MSNLIQLQQLNYLAVKDFHVAFKWENTTLAQGVHCKIEFSELVMIDFDKCGKT